MPQIRRHSCLQVRPAFNDDEPSCASSFLWWQQPVSGQQALWDLVRSCTANIRKESEEFGGLAFWARLLASKTLPELATAAQPPYTPPYTVSRASKYCITVSCMSFDKHIEFRALENLLSTK